MDIRQRQHINPFRARQRVEPVAWWADPAGAGTGHIAAHSLAERALRLRLAHKVSEAATAYAEALDALQRGGTTLDQARCHFDLATFWHDRRNDKDQDSAEVMERAQHHYVEALLRFVTLRDQIDSTELGDVTFNFAICREDRGSFETEHYAAALNLYIRPLDKAWCLMTWGNAWHKRMRDVGITGHDATRERGLAEHRLTQALAVLDVDTIPVERANTLPADAATALLASVDVDRAGAVAQALMHLANFRGTCADETRWPLQLFAREILADLNLQGVNGCHDRLRAAEFALAMWSGDDPSRAMDHILRSIDHAQQSLQSTAGPQDFIWRLGQFITSYQGAIRISLDRKPPEPDLAYALAQQAKSQLASQDRAVETEIHRVKPST